LPGLPAVHYRYTIATDRSGLQSTDEPRPTAPAFSTRVSPVPVQNVTRSTDGTAFTVTLPPLPAGASYHVQWCPARTVDGGYDAPTYAPYVTEPGGLCLPTAPNTSTYVRDAGARTLTGSGLDPSLPYEVWVTYWPQQGPSWMEYWNSSQGRAQVTGDPLPTAPSLPVV